MIDGTKASQQALVSAYDLKKSEITELERILAHSTSVTLVSQSQSTWQVEQMIVRKKTNLLLLPLNDDGLELVEQLMGSTPIPIAAIEREATSVRLQNEIVNAGALEVLTLPEPGRGATLSLDEQEILLRFKRLARAAVIRHPLGKLKRRTRRVARDSPELIAICCSAGGPEALSKLLDCLPADFKVPIACVQHLTGGFVRTFAAWLDNQSKLNVKVAEDGHRPVGGEVYIAPDGVHLTVDNNCVFRLKESPKDVAHIPSGNVLLSSVASSIRQRSVGIVLTGMGDDGAEGLADIRDYGGLTMAQDQESSAFSSMPQAAVKRGMAEFVLPLDSIAVVLAQAARGSQ